MEQRYKRIILEVVPGAVIALPIAFYLASAEIKYHPYWQAFFVAYLGFWFLIFAGIWFYFYAINLRKFLKGQSEISGQCIKVHF